MNRRRLYRSTDDRVLAGVAAGVADYFDVDPSLVRVLWVILVPFTGGLALLAYIVMAFVVPLEPDEWPAPSPWAPGGEPAGYSATYTPPPGAAGAAGAVPGAPADATTTSAGPTGPTGPTAPTFDTALGGSAAGPAATGTGDPTATAGPLGGANAAPTGGPAGPAAAGFAAVPPVSSSDSWSGRRQDRWQRRQDRWQRRQDRLQRRADRWEYRNGSGGLIFGLLLILVGGVLAWHQIDPRLDTSIAFPIAVVAFGVILVASAFIGARPRD